MKIVTPLMQIVKMSLQPLQRVIENDIRITMQKKVKQISYNKNKVDEIRLNVGTKKLEKVPGIIFMKTNKSNKIVALDRLDNIEGLCSGYGF